MQWKKLGNFDGFRLRADRFEWTANFARRIRLHIPQIDVAGSAQVENHDARGVFFAGFHEAGFFGGKNLRKRKTNGGERADVEKFAPTQARTTKADAILRGFGEEIEHGRILPEVRRASNGTFPGRLGPRRKWRGRKFTYRPRRESRAASAVS